LMYSRREAKFVFGCGSSPDAKGGSREYGGQELPHKERKTRLRELPSVTNGVKVEAEKRTSVRKGVRGKRVGKGITTESKNDRRRTKNPGTGQRRKKVLKTPESTKGNEKLEVFDLQKVAEK